MESKGKLTETFILKGKLNFPVPEEGTDTMDATAAAADIISGKTAYVKGKKINGNIDIERGEVSLESNDLSYVLDINGDYFKIPMNNENKRAISSISEALEQEELELVYKIPASVIANLIGLTADKIKSGEKVLGITGTAE